MNRCLIYIRVSTEDQDASNQTLQLEDYAKSQGWQIIDIVSDVCSGSQSAQQRAGLKNVFALAHQRKFDVLLFWSLDRFSREGSRKTIGYLEQLDGYGVDWHSYTEPYISSLGIFKDAIIALLSALAKQERVRISERTKAGLARARLEGKRLGRPRTDKSMIRKAQRLKNEGMTYAEVANTMKISRSRAFQLVKAD